MSVAPAGAGSNGVTTYEADCMGAGLAAGNVAPFVLGLGIDAQPDPSSPTGASFGASGTATTTIIGPVVAGLEQALAPSQIGAAPSATVGSTDGTATGSFAYSHTFANVPALGRQIAGVSWTSGSTTLTAAATTFQAGDVNRFVAGPSGGGINPQSTIASVAADGSSATITMATTAAQTNVAIGTGENMTFTDSTFSTGNVFTTNGVEGGKANIGVTSVNSVGVPNNVLGLVFGGQPGTSTSTSDARCLLTGFDAANNPGPSQFNQLSPLLPPGTTTALVAASGGFITQPNTVQAITPPAAAFVNLATPDTTPPVAGNGSATIDRNVSNTTTSALPATDNVAVAHCDLVAGSISDPRLGVSISNSPTPCQATLTDSGGASTGASVTFQYNATDTSNNTSTSPGTVMVTITPIPHLAITTTSPLPDATQGTAYSTTLQSSGGTPPVSWSATGLPNGLNVNSSTGEISGTPTQAGDFSVAVTATDADTPPETANATLALHVAAVADTTPPVANDGSTSMNAGSTATFNLPATDNVAVASCATAGSPSDPRLTVSVSNSPTACVATLTDSGATTSGATVTFQYNATDTSGNVSTSPGTVTVTIIPVVNDGSLDVIVNGPVSFRKTSKALVGKVTNAGTSTFQVCNTDFSWNVTVNGTPTGSVTMPTACATLGPGASKRFKATWNYPSVATGDTVVFTGTVNVAGDPTPGNNTDIETRTAK